MKSTQLIDIYPKTTFTKQNDQEEAPSQQETLNPPTIPRNAMGIRDAQDSGFITG